MGLSLSEDFDPLLAEAASCVSKSSDGLPIIRPSTPAVSRESRSRRGRNLFTVDHLIRSWMVEHQARSVEEMSPGVVVGGMDHYGLMLLTEAWRSHEIMAQFDRRVCNRLT